MDRFFHWIILYDIRDERRLARVAKILGSYAIRMQNSVFETDADDVTIEIMKRRLKKVIDWSDDFILIFSVCEKDLQKQEKYGKKVISLLHKEKFQVL